MTQREHLQNIFLSLIDSEIAILQFQKSIAKDKKDKSGLNKMINKGKKAKNVICDLRHTEILVSLYNSFVNGKEPFFITIERTINHKNTQKWDKTEKGFKEFVELEEQAKAQSKAEYEEKLKQKEMIENAKKQGKKIEMVFENGKLTPVIVENDN